MKKICKDGRVWGQSNKEAGDHLGILTGRDKSIKKGYNLNSAAPKGNKYGSVRKGSKLSKEQREKRCGVNSPNWKGGVSEKYQKHRKERGCREMSAKIFKRDNYQCQLCGKNYKLHAHHIIPWRVSHNDKMSNLITLCRSCHKRIEYKWWQYAPMFLEMNGIYTPVKEDDLFYKQGG